MVENAGHCSCKSSESDPGLTVKPVKWPVSPSVVEMLLNIRQ
jgi:hypothetical protein